MYRNLKQDYLAKYQDLPTSRPVLLGDAIKLIRRQAGLTVQDLATRSQLAIELIRSIEARKEVNTSWDSFQKIAMACNVEPEQAADLALEVSDSQCFMVRKDRPHMIEYDGYKVWFYSPPIYSPSDFVLMKFWLAPGKKTPEGLLIADQISGYVTDGQLTIQSNNESHKIKGNQGFNFESTAPHVFINESPDTSLEFFLLFKASSLARKEDVTRLSHVDKRDRDTPTLDMARILHYIRLKMSPTPNIALPWNILADLTNIKQATFSHLSGGLTELVPFEKLQSLSKASNVAFSDLIALGMGKDLFNLEICNSMHRGLFDFKGLYGASFYSASKPGTANRPFFLGQVTFQKKEMSKRMRIKWKHQSQSMIAFIVQDGTLMLEYGSKRKERLNRGDSVYLDASTPIILHNLEHQESKAYIFSNPPLF